MINFFLLDIITVIAFFVIDFKGFINDKGAITAV